MSTEQNSAEKEEPQSSEPIKKNKTKRRVLLTLGPLLVATVSLYIYWTGGRYVETENAYIQVDKVIISTEVQGTVETIHIDENRHVEKGDLLLTIDDRYYAVALTKAKANLQKVLAEIKTLKANYNQKLNQFNLARLDKDFAKKEYNRQLALAKKRVVPQARLDEAQHVLEACTQKMGIIKQEMAQILAQLEGEPQVSVEEVAAYKLGRAEVEKAELDMERTKIRASFSGIVSKVPKPGKYVKPGTAIMSLIADRLYWVEANFKETDLTNVAKGQPVEIEVDTYPDVRWTGEVASISPGTGSEFSILPAQNATGNWVKVVQRIPVRVQLNEFAGDQVLRSGMSTTVSIDTGYHRSLPAVVTKALGKLGIADAVMASPIGNK